MKTLIAFVLCLLASFSASAVTETNKTIVSMGVQIPSSGDGNTIAYVSVSPPTVVTCAYTILYISNLSTAGGTALYAMLHRAYSLSKPLSRIDYDKDSTTGQCFISLIEVGK